MAEPDFAHYWLLAHTSDPLSAAEKDWLREVRERFPEETRAVAGNALQTMVEKVISDRRGKDYPEHLETYSVVANVFVELRGEISGTMISTVRDMVLDKYLHKAFNMLWIVDIDLDNLSDGSEIPLVRLASCTLAVTVRMVGVAYHAGIEIEAHLVIDTSGGAKRVLADNGHIRLAFVHAVNVNQDDNIVIFEKTYRKGDKVLVEIKHVDLGCEGGEPRLEGKCVLVVQGTDPVPSE